MFEFSFAKILKLLFFCHTTVNCTVCTEVNYKYKVFSNKFINFRDIF